VDAGEGCGVCQYLSDNIFVECCFGGGDGCLVDAEVGEPVVQPFARAEACGMVVLDWSQCDIELEQGFHTGFLPAGFGVDKEAVHVENNGIELHRAQS